MDDPDCDSTWEEDEEDAEDAEDEDCEDGEAAGARDADAGDEDEDEEPEEPRAARPSALQVRPAALTRPGVPGAPRLAAWTGDPPLPGGDTWGLLELPQPRGPHPRPVDPGPRAWRRSAGAARG